MIGYYAYDDAIEGKRPGIVVVHEWWGLNDYAKQRARDLAELGYSALAIDMYGEGRNTEQGRHELHAGRTEGRRCSQGPLQRRPDLLKEQTQTDTDKLGAVGYCFGGKVVPDMARQGVPLDGVVSFHGALATETRAAPGSVKARVLVEHGAEDSMISADDVAALNVEMVKAGADYQFVSLPGPSTASPIRAPMPIRRTASTWPIRKPPTSAPGVICSGSSRTPSARRRLPGRSDRSTRRVRFAPAAHACRRGSC